MRKINTIYIVDDDPILIFGIKKMLSAIVICDKVYAYKNGKLALDGFATNFEENNEVPDIIFLDINMPIMDGWQFLEAFISLDIKKKVRINILTSSIDVADKENWEKYKVKTHHIITYNRKPIRKSDLAEITIAS